MPLPVGRSYLLLTALIVAALYRATGLLTPLPPHMIVEAVHLWVVVFFAPWVLVTLLARGLSGLRATGRRAARSSSRTPRYR